MITKMLFIAEDGRTFDNEEDCRRYEAILRKNEESPFIVFANKFIHFKNKDGNEAFFCDINSFKAALFDEENCFLTIDPGIPDNVLELFNLFLYEMCEIPVIKPDQYRWDENDDKWISYEEDYARFCEKWQCGK